MKVYDYRCLNPACGIIFEEWVDDKDVEVPCPNCECVQTKIIFVSAPRMQEKKQPYDYIGKHRTDDPIKSFVPKSFEGKRK